MKKNVIVLFIVSFLVFFIYVFYAQAGCCSKSTPNTEGGGYTDSCHSETQAQSCVSDETFSDGQKCDINIQQCVPEESGGDSAVPGDTSGCCQYQDAQGIPGGYVDNCAVETHNQCNTRGGTFYTGKICQVEANGSHVCKEETGMIFEEIKTREDIVSHDEIFFKPQVSIPGSSEFVRGSQVPVVIEKIDGKYIATLVGHYIVALYNFVIIVVGFLAVIMIILGGFQWMAAAGNPEKISGAQKRMIDAIMGLVLVLGSYTLLRLINPELVSFRGLEIEPIVGISDEEDANVCRQFPIDPEEDGCCTGNACDGEVFKKIGGKIWLQTPAAIDLLVVLEQFKNAQNIKLQINSGFRSYQRQQCLYNTLGPSIANTPGTSKHEQGLAVDINVSDLTTPQYKALIDIASQNGFKNAVFDSGTAVGLDDSVEWKSKKERWHFGYTRGGVHIDCVPNSNNN